MSFTKILVLVQKAFKFYISRPLQRFNIENRAVKYLGPDAKKFVLPPRAIGRIGGLSLKELPRYPHLNAGFKSIGQKRRAALESEKGDQVPKLPKSYSERELDDRLVIETSNKLDVIKKVTSIQSGTRESQQIRIGSDDPKPSITDDAPSDQSHRPLPKSTNLPLQDIRAIWQVEHTKPGRLNLDMLQELMINKLADHDHWTPAAIADRYKIREEYAEKLIASIKQIRIRVSPRIATNLEVVGLNNPLYNAAKHLIFHVDKSMRSEYDRKFDSMFLPTDELPEDVRQLIDPPGAVQLDPKRELATGAERKRLKRPAPLRIAPVNTNEQSQRPASIVGHIPAKVKKLEAPKEAKSTSNNQV